MTSWVLGVVIGVGVMVSFYSGLFGYYSKRAGGAEATFSVGGITSGGG